MKELPQLWIAVYTASIRNGDMQFMAKEKANNAIAAFMEVFAVKSTGETGLIGN